MNLIIYDKLNREKDTNPNNNLNLLNEIITTAMDNVLPVKTIKYNNNTNTKSHVGLHKASSSQ